MTALRATDAELMSAYVELGSVHKVGARFGMRGTSAHERLSKLGVVKPIRVFTDDERDILRRDYVLYRDLGRLSDLAARMGRTVPFLARQARTLGLTDARHPKPYLAVWKYVTEEQAALILDDFKRSRLGVNQYVAKKGWDDEGFRKTMCRYFADEWEAVVESKAPRQSRYRLGRSVEYAARDDLRRHGYFVMRSPASKTPLDLIAVAPGVVLFVQAKRSGALPVAEWNELFDLAVSVAAVPLLVSRPTGRGLIYHRLFDRKDGSKRRQPYEPWHPGVRVSVTEVPA